MDEKYCRQGVVKEDINLRYKVKPMTAHYSVVFFINSIEKNYKSKKQYRIP